MQAAVQWLKGKKTYLATILLGLVGLGWSEGWVSDDVAKVVTTVLATAAGLAFRSAITNLETKVDPDAKE